MLPETLIGIYKQYKQDTDSVASWLASTAKACGYPADLLSSGTWDAPRQSGSGRLKGKARKLAREAGKGNTVAAKPSKYIVAIADFVPLANFIAASRKPLISVPEAFAAILNRVIALRASFGERLNEHGAKSDAEADIKHSYFVGVLEEVRDALRSRMSVTDTVAVAVASDPVGNLANRFASLTIYEPSQAFLDAPDIRRPKQPAADNTIYEAEAQTSLEDVLFAFTMMINDLNRIRSVIEWIWLNHKRGMFDLAACAVATNTAIELARALMEDVIPLCRDHDGTWGVLNKFFLMCALRAGYTMDQLFADSRDNFNYDTYEIADGVYFTAYRILLSFLDVLDPRDLPLIKEGMFGTYDPTNDRGSKTGQAKFQEDQILLMEFFTELMTVVRLIPDYPVEDEFLRGMKEMEETRQVPFYLVFAAQIFIDIHHTLRDTAVRSSLFMRVQISVMGLDLKSHLDFHKNLKIDHWPASNDRMLRDLFKMMQWIANDPVYEAKIRVMQRRGMLVPESMQPHRILDYSPVLAGLLLFRFRSEMYTIGIAVANAWGSIQYTVHLCHALERERLLDGRWPDMDVARALLKESNFFVGEPPETMDDHLKKFCLQMGVTAAALSNPRGRKRKTSLASRAGPRGIKDGVPVSQLFTNRYLTRSGQVDWTPKHIEDIISRSEYEFEGSEEDGTLTMGQISDPEKLNEKKRAQKQKAKAGEVCPSLDNLTKSLILALQAETIEISFPYLTLHRNCWTFLRSVKRSCNSVLMELYTPAYMEKETELPFVVGYVFMAACGAEGVPRDMRPIQAAAKAFNDLVGTEESTMSLEALRTMGHNVEFGQEESESESE